MTRLEVHIKHFCTTKHGGHLKEKHLCNCFELQAELTTFFPMEHHFFKLWSFKLGYLADDFSKTHKVRLSLQGKQLSAFVVDDKVGAFKLC